jgi:hypothetical protein
MSSTFAPPTGPPLTGAPAAITPEMEPAPATPSGGRRRPFALAAAVFAVVALGIGAFVALAGERPSDVAEPYSLLAAAESTIAARTVEFDLDVSAADLAEVTVTGAVDNESKIMSVTTDLSSLLALGEMPMPFGGGDITVLVDGSAGVVYLDAGVLGGLLPDDAAWISLDLGDLAEQSGQALDDLQGQFALDPADLARSLLDSDDVTEIGLETIDGVEARHYEVTVDLAAALAAVPQTGLDPSAVEIGLPGSVTLDVWVTADNQLRRVSFDTEVAGQPIAMQLDMNASDEPLGVELPAESEVVDLTDLLGF